MTGYAPPPVLGTDALAAALADRFGIVGRLTPLSSERDLALRFDAGDGQRFVVKVANAAESDAFLTAEDDALRAAERTGLCRAPMRTLDGAAWAVVDGARVRVVPWVDGVTLASVRRPDGRLLAAVGDAVARVDRALAPIAPPGAERRFAWDLAVAADTISDGIGLVRDPAIAATIGTVLDRHQRLVGPRTAGLPRSLIHNDANEHNVIVSAPDLGTDGARSVVALIDFGDIVVSERVNGLSVAVAYASLVADDPVGALSAVVRGYHRTWPLDPDEIDVVFELVLTRLALSACQAARQSAADPTNAYLGVSQNGVRRVLPQLAALHPRLGLAHVRAACDLPAFPASATVRRWLAACEPVPVIDVPETDVVPIDLGVGSLLVANDPADNGPQPLGARIEREISDHAGRAGAGGYGEHRLLYDDPRYDTPAGARRLHLGVDITVPVGTALHSPLPATVRGVEFCADALDYGTAVVLEHRTDDDTPFFTLWGHLDHEVLTRVRRGDPIPAGGLIGRIGDVHDNGGWWPHTHVQLIVDMLDVPVNYPGACVDSQRAVWLDLCPDPNLLLRLPHPPAPPSTTDLLARRRAVSPANVRLAYGDAPLQIVRGRDQWLYDETGRRFLDAYNNVAHVGHGHRRVVQAAARQLAVLNTNTRYVQRQYGEYAEALLARFPDVLDTVMFTASGTEATDLALRLARAATGGTEVVVLESAYHGHSPTAIDLSPYKHLGPGGSGTPDWVHVAPLPDRYRGAVRGDGPDVGAAYAQRTQAVIDAAAARGPLCAYLAETCPSVAGQILLPDGYLAPVHAAVRAAGGVCIADEVQTGFGRLGTTFWGFAAHGVVPDVVVLGKPIANGFPLGAVVCRREIADAFDRGMEFFSTFGGTTAALAAAHETLRVVDDEALPANAATVGDRLLERLRALADDHQVVGDVRGSGLFIGVQLVQDRTSRAPATEHARFVVRRARELGVLLGTDGPHDDVLKLRGPLTLRPAQADLIADVLDVALGEVC